MFIFHISSIFLQFVHLITHKRSNLIFIFFFFPDDKNCPVQLYLLFKEKRPSLDPSMKFYLGINKHWENTDSPWYIRQPMGKNTIGSMARTMSEAAGFTARHTNHSGRKTAITTLLEAGCQPTEVAQISGHKNLQSLNHYHSISVEKQKEMSTIIHRNKTSSITEATESMDDDFDDELVRASQEIEQTLQKIESYEQVKQVNTKRVIDLPLIRSPGGTLRMNPMSLFKNCTFNSNVTINMK